MDKNAPNIMPSIITTSPPLIFITSTYFSKWAIPMRIFYEKRKYQLVSPSTRGLWPPIKINYGRAILILTHCLHANTQAYIAPHLRASLAIITIDKDINTHKHWPLKHYCHPYPLSVSSLDINAKCWSLMIITMRNVRSHVVPKEEYWFAWVICQFLLRSVN